MNRSKVIEAKLLDRIQKHAREWRVVVEDTFQTESSLIAFGTRDNQPVVLKLTRQEGDEWESGKVLAAFGGNGFAGVYEHAPGAVLLERLIPGYSLVKMSLESKDEEATDILADVTQRMPVIESATHCPTVHHWARGFERYIATGDQQIPKHLVAAGQQVFLKLCASQRQTRLLHGDLQHYNVLFDSARGWLAIDPKGVMGEIEYEIGAVLRNPCERPELFLSPPIIERRLKQFAKTLALNSERTLAWAFAQAVLSAIWQIEDGFAVNAMNPALRLVEVIRPMVGA